MANKYLFVTVANDAYIDGLLVTIFSLMENSEIFLQSTFKVYHHKKLAPLSSENKKTITKILPQTIFEEVEIPNIFTEKFIQSSPICASYLFMNPFSEIGYDQVICIDADLLFIKNIDDLFLLKNTGIMAVGEFESSINSSRLRRFVRKICNGHMLDNKGLTLSLREYTLAKIFNGEISLKNTLKKILNTFKKSSRKWAPSNRNPINCGFFVISGKICGEKNIHRVLNEAKKYLDSSSDFKSLADQPIINNFKDFYNIPITLLNYTFNTAYITFCHYENCQQAHLFDNVRVFHLSGVNKPWLAKNQLENPKAYNFVAFEKWRETFEQMKKHYSFLEEETSHRR